MIFLPSPRYRVGARLAPRKSSRRLALILGWVVVAAAVVTFAALH